MNIRMIPGSLLALTLATSCGGARDVGQRAVETQRGQRGSAGGSDDSAGYRVIAASGAVSGNLARPVTMGRDDAPTLVTVQGRSTADNRAVNIAVDRESVPGVAPSSGGYVVRRAGAPSGDGTRPRTQPTSAPTAVGGVSGSTSTTGGRVRVSADEASSGAGAPVAQSVAEDRAEPPARLMAPPVNTTPGGGPARAPMARPVPVGGVPVGSTVTVTTTVAVTPPVIVEAQQETAGLLTAASVGDADRFSNYLDYLSRHTSEAGELRLDMTRRLRIRVVDSQGRGVNAARVRLSNQGGTVEALTHADGSFDYFPGLSTAQLAGVARLDVTVESLTVGADVQIPTQGDGQPVMVRLNAAVVPPAPVLDLGFLIDVTGSMGDELRYVNREIASIVQRIERDSPGVRVRLSATFYRDRVDETVVQQIPFTSNVQGFAAAMQNVYASGGGDYPEDLNAGIDAAMNRLAWSDGAAVRVLVLVADAPPQHYGDSNFTYREAMVRASQRGIRLLPVAASGSDRRVEFLFRAMGAYTSTPYVYLTDDSGVGGSHMEADTDRVAVERFNDALVRLITSDLRGEGMHEPGRIGAERN